MCECGCVGNDEHYRFPGPGKTFYVLTLSGGCISCSAPSGFTIEHVKPGEFLYDWYTKDAETTLDGELKFQKWNDRSGIAAVITGMLREEFIEATKQHLIGVDSKEMGDKNRKIDEIGAETILEEMYEDATFRPSLVDYAAVDDGGGS